MKYYMHEPPCTNVGQVSTIVTLVIVPFREWTERVQLDDPFITKTLERIERINEILLVKYGQIFHGFN